MRAIKIELIKRAIELSGAWFPFLTTKPVTNVQHYPLKLFWRPRRRFSWNCPIDLDDNHLCLPLLYLPRPPPLFLFNISPFFPRAGREIAPTTGANATKFFTLATKSWKLFAKLATIRKIFKGKSAANFLVKFVSKTQYMLSIDN